MAVAQEPILTVYLGNTVSIVCDILLGSIPTLISRFLGSIAVGDFWPRRADHNSILGGWRFAIISRKNLNSRRLSKVGNKNGRKQYGITSLQHRNPLFLLTSQREGYLDLVWAPGFCARFARRNRVFLAHFVRGSAKTQKWK